MANNKEFMGDVVVKFGCIFVLGKYPKFDRDLDRVSAILEKETITAADRIQLLTIYKSSYHDSGKIEGVTSFDSSATNCAFCRGMRHQAEGNPAHICNACYDFAAEQYKITALNRHTLNMVIMSRIDFEPDELRIIPASLINRINSSGDIPNKTYARNMIKIALVNPLFHFGFWAKNTAALIAATDELGKPENAVYIQSSPIIGTPAEKAKYFDHVFTVYVDADAVKAAIEGGAAECNGKKCRECGYKCYLGTHGADNIAELLRGVNAKKRAAIAAACQCNA